MAAFTTMALLGLGMAAGSAASRLANRRRNPADSGVLAPGATPVSATPVMPAPVDATRAASDAMLQAPQAAQRQRRRARAAPGLVPVSGRNPGAILQPRTLLGAPTSLLGG